jgi:hypothetical protein
VNFYTIAALAGGVHYMRFNSGVEIQNTDGNSATGLRVARFIEAVTTTKSASAVESNELYTNEGDADGATVNLPTAAAGLCYTAVVQAAQTLTIDAAAGDTIRVGANVTAADGAIDSATVGDSVTLCAVNATEWVATALIGTGF